MIDKQTHQEIFTPSTERQVGMPPELGMGYSGWAKGQEPKQFRFFHVLVPGQGWAIQCRSMDGVGSFSIRFVYISMHLAEAIAQTYTLDYKRHGVLPC